MIGVLEVSGKENPEEMELGLMESSEKTLQNQKRQRRNPRSVYLAALCKLCLDALLIVLFADRLTEWKVFGEVAGLYEKTSAFLEKTLHVSVGIRTFFLAGAVLWALLYLLMLSTLKIRNRTGYLYFSLFFIFDAVFLMQPSKTVLLFALCTLLLLLFRLKSGWRYVPAALLLAGYALWMNPYLLAILPLFALALVWRHSEKWGFRLFLLYLIALCLTYQFEYLDFLPHARGTSDSPTFFANLFEDEEIYGHISYYLINYLVTLLRILFPVELFFRSTPHSCLFFPVQLGALLLCFRTVWYLLDVDWKREVRPNDRMTHDVLTFVLSFVALQAVYEPDLGQVFRHMTGLTPCYLYLLFEANHRHEKPFVERSFSGTCPVIFFHRGGEDYVYDALQKAGEICGSQNVILLGDEANRGFTSNWYPADAYLGERAQKFHEVYRHISEHHSEEFEITCFDRHFALYEFCAEKEIPSCFFCDSDVLLYHNPAEDDYSCVDFACCSAELPVSLGEASSPHFTYWRQEYLSQFLDFVTHVYSSQTAWLEDVSKQASESETYTNTDISDTVLLTAWKRIITGQDKAFTFRNHDEISDGRVCDHNMTSSDNEKTGQFRYSRALGIKKLRFRKGEPVLTTTEGEKVAATVLHCQAAREAYTYPLTRGSNCKLWYWLNRVGHKLMG